MKRLIFTFCLVLYFTVSANAVVGGYIMRCGREFYHYIGGWVLPEEEKFYRQERIIFKKEVPESYGLEKLKAELNKKMNDEIYRLYLKNKDYMWEHYPESKYTFEELLEMLKRGNIISRGATISDGTIYYYVNISPKCWMTWKLQEYEVCIGYLYKGVQYDPSIHKFEVEYTRYDE